MAEYTPPQERRQSPSEAEAYIFELRNLLLWYHGTTDPELLADIWKEQAARQDKRNPRHG